MVNITKVKKSVNLRFVCECGVTTFHVLLHQMGEYLECTICKRQYLLEEEH